MAGEKNQTPDMMHKLMKAEYLDAVTERELAVAWRDNGDDAALHRLVTAHMRLAVSMALKFRRYGASTNDLIQEAGLGLLKAAEKFDPDRGVRFSTYAGWWVKASIQEFVMRNWSLVRTGTTSAHKSLFFNMRRVEAQLERAALADGNALEPAEMSQAVAKELGVPLRDVLHMQGRLQGSDFSLDAPQSSEEEGRTWGDMLEDESPGPEAEVGAAHDTGVLKSCIAEAVGILSPRERRIVEARKLTDGARTLESLGAELGISKERVRQIEVTAFEKMRNHITQSAPEIRGLLAV